MLPRVRKRFATTDSPAIWAYKRPSDPSPVLSTPPCLNFTEYEGIVDVVGNYPNFSPCSHIKINQVPGSISPFTEDFVFPPHSETLYLFGDRLPYAFNNQPMLDVMVLPYGENLSSELSVLSPGDAASFTRSALDKVLRQVPEEISIANFLLELRDVKSLLPIINGWKTIPEQFLNWNFGWLPFIQDIKKLLMLVANVRQRLEHLKRLNGRTVTISHQARFVTVDNQNPPPAPDTHPQDGEASVSITTYEEVKVRQHMTVAYDLDLHGADAFCQAMCSALGLMNPAKIIWNAIPFSFVIDWIIDIGSLIDTAMMTEPFKGTIAIKAASCSAKTKTFISHYHPYHYPAIGSREMAQYATTLVRGYHRRSGTLEGTIEVTGLTPFQQALAAALVAANADLRLPTRRKRKAPRL